MNRLTSINSFRRLSLAASLFFMAVSGCGKFDTAHLKLSEDGSRGTVMARFFQDQNIYEKELPFRNVDGYALFDDDIILGRISTLGVKPLKFILPSAKTGVLDSSDFIWTQANAFSLEGGDLWKKGIVPYVIKSEVSVATDSLKSAMQSITSNTGIKFVERTNENDYLEFVKSPDTRACAAYVGRITGAQQVWVLDKETGCGLSGNVHELLHAIGMWHEHTRSDRDAYVEILYDNIIEGFKGQFDILPGVILGAYDFTSVMHYGVKSFSKNGNDTIRSRNGQKIERVVPMSGLDASGVKELYKAELSSSGGQCDPAAKGTSCGIVNGTGQMEDQTCNTSTQQWVGGVCRVKTCNTGFQPDSARAACVQSGSNNEAPRGYVDRVNVDGVLEGWSYDPNSSGTSIDVHYYIDGVFAGANKADKPRSDVNTAFGIAGNHGFEFRVPDSYRNDQPHTIRAYGIDLQGQTNPELGSKSFTLGSGTPAVTGLSFVSGSYSVGVTGSASNLPDTTMWCLTPGSGTCTPDLSRMQDWVPTGASGNNRFNWKYEIRPYQAGWCPGTFTAVVQAPGETKLSASFTIGYPNTSVSNSGLRVNNVPPPSVGVLKACFEYYEAGGPNGRGTCGTPAVGNTAIIGNGWSYNESDHYATFNGDSSVFGGHHGTVFFTFEYNCGLKQTVSGSF